MTSSSHDREHAWHQDLPDLRPYVRGGNPLLIIISGPSGAGKDAVVRRMEELGYPFCFVITATTRPPREGEQEGADYFFLSESEFLDLIERGELLEHALVYGEHKGIPKRQVRQALASGRDVVMRLDVQGAATVRGLVPDAILVFLIPGSEEELLQRLRRRKTETAVEFQRRVTTMREEMKRIPEFDYVVVNQDGQLDRAVEAIVAIMRAEKCRTKQRVIRL
jgi:guanylate kinase